LKGLREKEAKEKSSHFNIVILSWWEDGATSPGSLFIFILSQGLAKLPRLA
jgi:hypothetical protein